ncbi:hypothetical protein [Fervidobacterium thailandense]|uniref:Outer membrane protein beta-barrel domain-containing protein n=1 Tax=Fervidobacterium thailandense TaxID=1008305 RepID=A0A1E3G3F4_9BACT|nr:hypothetical protein [Fervidobacterium thailandense]ODN30739.1 hypothetical protein A4H02_04210 [Fervidobacterium thailandense]
MFRKFRKASYVFAFLTTILVGFVGTTFGFNFGGGGPLVLFFPGGTVIGELKNLNVPIVNVGNFGDGILAVGGFGYGGVPGGLYSGGFGFGGEREYTTPDGTFKVSVGGGFGMGLKKINFDNISLFASLGFGGVDFSIAKKVNEGKTSLDDLKSGQLEGYLGASISYTTLSVGVGASLKISFVELSLGGIMFLGFSTDGWTVNGKKLTGVTDSSNLLLSYSLFGGVGFGF